MNLSSKTVERSRHMGHVLGEERSSERHQTLDAVKEKTPLPWRGNGSLFQDKHRTRHSFCQPYIDPKCELRQTAGGEKVSQFKSSEIDRKDRPGGRACDDNELVKHMSNLPGFLLKVEKENTIQDKALNFGVLDWKRLEKWKYTERMPGKLPKRISITGNSCSSASGPPKTAPNLRKQPTSHSPNPILASSTKQPMPHGSNFSSPQRQPSPPHSSPLNMPKKERYGSYHMEEEHVESIKSKGKETSSQEYQGAESYKIGRQKNHVQQKVDFYNQSCPETDVLNSKRKDAVKDKMSERVTSSSSSKQGKHKISLLSPNKGAQERTTEMRPDEVKETSKSCPADSQNIVSRVPKNFHEKSCSESSLTTESRTSVDGQLTALTENRLSDFFSPQELYSGEFSADVPHSCPLPTTAGEPHILLTSQAIDVDICTSAGSNNSMSSKANCSLINGRNDRPSVSPEASNKKVTDVAEQHSVKGRTPSPTRRFSFNLGRMSRSFSFKESSPAPQLNSTYTSVRLGPVRPEVAPGMDNDDREQGNARNRGRSSPLRRLLDPLLKHRTAPETVRPPCESLRPMNVSTPVAKELPKDRKPKAATFQALLQLTFKNGLPFFKLLVENSKDMLAATVKRLPTSGKSDSCLIYSFYSVHEIKKKSMNWINQGSKSKTYSLGYNIMGQMKISNSSDMKVNTCGTRDLCARECVLFGVDPAQVDKPILEFLPNKEIAAFVIKNSNEKVNDGVLRDKNQPFEVTEFLQNSNGVIVILPGGVHGMPTRGAPSSLISRWRSSESCDCGGWDIGCKVRVLAESGKTSNVLRESMSSSTDHVNLYIQGRDQKSKPVFSLKPFSNEFYSIELDASISLLEAFATSVAYITCWKFPEIIETKGQSEAAHSPETGKKRTPNAFKEQIPAKYVTCPPLSPAGRI